jgi:XTP/dITP diphosphohydrolase
MFEIWLATSNLGKIKEFERLFASVVNEGKVVLKSIKDMNTYSAPAETGETFEANARIKAKAVRAIKNHAWVLADDSGLIVEGLGGLPGVHSARYAGPKATDSENTMKLLKMVSLRTAMNRKAQFKSVLVLISPEGEEHIFQGELNGSIATNSAGTEGFGYDPVFIPEGQTKTLAQLTLAEKNKLSHRARAVEQVLNFIKQ